MWLAILSDQLPIVALVGPYPTNQLIGRRPLIERPKALLPFPGPHAVLAPVSQRYPPLNDRFLRVTHPFATHYPTEAGYLVRLACLRYAASVCPEPGSNSPSKPCRVDKVSHHCLLSSLESLSSIVKVPAPPGGLPRSGLPSLPTPAPSGQSPPGSRRRRRLGLPFGP